jgi:hypothetical protein
VLSALTESCINRSRLIVSLVVANGFVYQSYNYDRLLPVGDLSVTLDRLRDYEVDECVIKLLSDDDNRTINQIDKSQCNFPLGLVFPSTSDLRIEHYINAGIDRIGFENDWMEPSRRNKVFHWVDRLGKQSCFLHIPYGAEIGARRFSKRSWSLEDAIKFIKMDPPPVGELIFWDVGKEHDYEVMNSDWPDDFLTKNFSICVGGGLPASSVKNPGKVNGIVVGNIMHRREHEYQKIKEKLGLFSRDASYKGVT